MNKWITFDRVCTGSSHRARQLPCQDAVRCHNTSQFVLAVAADGVSSLCNAHIAADTAVNSTVDWFEQHYQNLKDVDAAYSAIRDNLIKTLQQSILRAARDNGVLPDTMDCNLTFACILPEYGFAFWGVLGDGAVCVFRKDLQYVVSAANTFSANATETILQNDAAQRIRLGYRPLADGQVLGFMVTSDGLEGELYDKTSMLMRSNAEHYFNAMLLPTEKEREESIDKLLKQLPPELDDDISLVIISNAQRTQKITLPTPTWLCTCGTRNALNSDVCANCRTSFLQLYGAEDFKGSRELFFVELNQDPQREKGLLSRTAAKTEQESRGKPRVKKPRFSRGQKTNHDKPSDHAAPSGAGVKSTRQNETVPEKQPIVQKTAPAQNTQNTTGSQSTWQHQETVQNVNLPEEQIKVPLRYILAALAACIAVVWLVVLSVMLFSAHNRISVLEEQLTSNVQVGSSVGQYTVTDPDTKLLRIEDGQIESVLVRFEEGDLLERLDDQEITVNGVVYIHVETAQGQKGWCKLNSLTEAVP